MHATRIVLVTVLAPVFAAIPYFAAAVWGFADSGGGPPAQGALVCIVLVLFGATAAVLCLGIARIVWKNREKVSRRFLFGFYMVKTLLLRATLALGGGSSLLSR